VSSAKSVRLHMQASVRVIQMIPNTREGRLCTGRSSNCPDVVCKPLPDRLCKSNCNCTATEFFNNGCNSNSVFTASRTCSPPGRPSVAKIMHSVVVQLQAFNLGSATQCGAVVRCDTNAYPDKSNDGMVPQKISHETVHQSIVEGGIVCNIKLAHWMASSSSLFIGIDESTKSTKKSFVEIKIGGQLMEVVSHSKLILLLIFLPC